MPTLIEITDSSGNSCRLHITPPPAANSEDPSRRNLLAMAQLQAPNARAKPPTETLAPEGEDDDNDANLCAPFLVEPDLSKSDYSVKPRPPSVAGPAERDPTTRALLTQCDEAAYKARKFYSDALARCRGQGPLPAVAPHAQFPASNPDTLAMSSRAQLPSSNPDTPVAASPRPPLSLPQSTSEIFKIPEAPRAMLQKPRLSPHTSTATLPDSPSNQLFQEIDQTDAEGGQGCHAAEATRRPSLGASSSAALIAPAAGSVAAGDLRKTGAEIVGVGDGGGGDGLLRTPVSGMPVIQRVDASRDPRLRR